MAYPALPDHRMAYDNDGTLVYYGRLADGAIATVAGATLLEWQDMDLVNPASPTWGGTGTGTDVGGVIWFFFPEQREITGQFVIYNTFGGLGSSLKFQGSNDTANGLDGTWELASLPGGAAAWANAHSWRSGIKPVSFTGPKKNLRIVATPNNQNNQFFTVLHLYGEPAAGQMAHDLVYINHDDTPGVAFTAAEDFGDQPLGTTVVRQFRIKNTSATRTATNLNIQLNDAEFVIAENPAGPWVVTINLASLGPGAESPTYYIRLTTPAPGENLDPHAARIITVCDAGFFG
jgi:hypothetical protein